MVTSAEAHPQYGEHSPSPLARAAKQRFEHQRIDAHLLTSAAGRSIVKLKRQRQGQNPAGRRHTITTYEETLEITRPVFSVRGPATQGQTTVRET